MTRFVSAYCMLLCFLLAPAGFAQWNGKQLGQAESFGEDQRIVGTHYFYWYDYPREHFSGGEGVDILQDHFPDPEAVSYHSPDWHGDQLKDCAEAGIDFILPVYWGVVDRYSLPGTSFSVQGLGPLQHAMDRRLRAGETTPKIGMFYDTSTLLPNYHHAAAKLDLRTEQGKDIFYRTIRDFFYRVEPRHWATIGGRPLVVLYVSAFAGNYDQSTFDAVYERFARDFHGRRPYIIHDTTWDVTTDGAATWGAALYGPKIADHVAQIGPGYNDLAVPGRNTPIREREEGRFYRWSWNRVLDRPEIRIVLIETWNEMHEATDICRSREYGRSYIDLTRTYTDLFHQGKRAGERIVLQYPEPRPRPPSSKGEEFRNAKAVAVRAGKGGTASGLWLLRHVPDGPVNETTLGGKACSRSAADGVGYLYFNIADPFLWGAEEPVVIEYTFWDDGFKHLVLQYDSGDGTALLDGAYKSADPVSCGHTRTWKTIRVRVDDPRFMNRQNGGADFRLAAQGGRIAVSFVQIRKEAGGSKNQ